MDHIDCIVIGAGVVGLAIARAVAIRGLETIVLEAESTVGLGTSSRNSEVIHAGLYYPAGSLKARFCRQGRDLLYEYCRDRGVEVRRCGKLIVATGDHATGDQHGSLERIYASARANDVADIEWLTRDEARALEPALECLFALHSPSTGIVDGHGLMRALRADFEQAGGTIAFRSRVSGGECGGAGLCLRIEDQGEIHADIVINSAGLHAQSLAAAFDGFDRRWIPPLYLAKGNYFALRGRCPFTRLIYPVPNAAGLGTHLTMDTGGGARFGPDVEWVEHLDYAVDPHRAAGFYDAIRSYWPALPDEALSPAYAGIRPKLVPAGKSAADFMILGPETHGVAGLIHLFGIESPGLTSALAIGEHVAARAA